MRRTWAGLLVGGSVAMAVAGGGLPAVGAAEPGPAVVDAAFTVTSAADSGPGTLRQAMADAAATAGLSTITVAPQLDPIVLATEISWGPGPSTGITIDGNGVTIDLGGRPRGLVVTSDKPLVMHAFTMTNARGELTQPDVPVAPIVSSGGGVTVSACQFIDNRIRATEVGGGDRSGDVAGGIVAAKDKVTVTDCTFGSNQARADEGNAAGAVVAHGPIQVDQTTITFNFAVSGWMGGDTFVSGGFVSDQFGNEPSPGDPNRRIDVTRSAFILNAVTNRGGGSGGGAINNGAPIAITDSSAFCNTAQGGSLPYAIGAGVAYGVKSRVDFVRTVMVSKDLDPRTYPNSWPFGFGADVHYTDSPARVLPEGQTCRAGPPTGPGPTAGPGPTTSTPATTVARAVAVNPNFTG